jgi:hypothetical protein
MRLARQPAPELPLALPSAESSHSSRVFHFHGEPFAPYRWPCGTSAGSRAVDEFTGAPVVRALPACRAVFQVPDILERILKESS